MKKTFLTSAIGCFGLLWCLGCEAVDELGNGVDEDLSDRATSVGLYQAESFTSQSGCKIATNNKGYTGSGFVDYGLSGTWIELNNVNAAQAGSYTLTFRYATPSVTRPCALYVNGANVGNVAFTGTGSWTTWKTVSITKPLKAGKNTIRIMANTSAGGPNLDSMELFSNIVDNCPSDPNKTEPGLCGCGVAEGSCSGSSGCVEAAENKTVALSCPTGKTIASVSFASYGLPTGACPGGFATSSCHAASSLEKVKASCLNKASCSVVASNAVFGDPCSGKAKKLAVVYTCSGGTPVDLCPNDPKKTEPGKCGCGVAEGTCGTASGSFTLGLLPDVQKVTMSDTNAEWLYKVGDFFVDQKEELNLLAVASVGDLVQDANLPGTRNQTRWDRVLNFAHDLRAENVHFIPSCGNHDGCQDNYGQPEDYAAQFSDLVRQNGPDGSPRAYVLKRDNPYFRGSYSTVNSTYGMENAYYRFEVGGRPFIVLALRFGDSSETQALTAAWNNWAKKVLGDNSDATAIIVTHYLSNSPAWLNSSKPVLCDYKNVFMVLEGHTHGSRYRKLIDCGNGHKVERHQFSFGHGTEPLNEAAARLYTFDLAAGEVCFKTRHVFLNKWLTDTAGCSPTCSASTCNCDDYCIDLPPAP
ncbi:MAG: carbohydrate-binding protein [Myxococcota bacterium]|jgi:hypothetical protein|nr:carbohydrate-binding protein [Myxococcota bacterium]